MNNIAHHIDDSLEKVRAIYQKASDRIELLQPGEKIPATELAKQLATELDTTGPALYPILKLLFDGYPGVEIKRGAHGGILKLPIK